MHVHPRGPDGRESLEPEHCGAAVAALREAAPKLEISLSTGLWITGGDVERRLECVRGWTELPDCVSLNVIEEGWERARRSCSHERGIWIEIGLWRAEPSRPARRPGLARRCRRALVEPQETAPAIAVATAGAIDGGLERERIDAAAAAPRHRPHHLGGARRRRAPRARGPDRLRGHAIALPDARRAGSNAELVAAAAERYLSPSG